MFPQTRRRQFWQPRRQLFSIFQTSFQVFFEKMTKKMNSIVQVYEVMFKCSVKKHQLPVL